MVCAPKQDSSQANPLVRGTKTTTLLVGLYFYITFTISFNAILQMKPDTVRKLLRDGEITGSKVGPRLWRIPREEVSKYIAKQQAAPVL